MNTTRTPPFVSLVVICAMALLWFVFLLFGGPDEVVMVPDSLSYINFSSFRSAGYPIFLDMVGVTRVTWVQPLIAAVALGYLGYEIGSLSRSIVVPIVVMLLVIANYRFNTYHYTILTESIYMSVLMLILGSWIRYVCYKQIWSLLLLSCLAGIAISIRPVALFLVPLVIIVVLVFHVNHSNRVKLRRLALVLVPALLITTGERLLTYTWHDGDVSSLLGRHMYAKAGLIGDNDRSNSRHGAALDVEFQPVRRFIDAAPSFAVKNHFLPHYEICTQYSCSARLDLEAGSDEAKSAAFARIKAHPLEFLELAFFNYRSLWTIYNSSGAAASEIEQYLAQTNTMPFGDELKWLTEPIPPQGRIKPLLRLSVWLVGFFSFLTMAYTLYQWLGKRELTRSDNVRVFCAFGLHGALMTIALTGVSVPRYIISLWPLLILYTVMFYPGISRGQSTRGRSPR